jgi:glyoxylase-like metal-dependent hydrolase (beta-lactamase superfamily II)
VRTISADELLALLDAGAPVCVLDVREPDEFSSWSIPGARNVPLGQLATRFGELPRDCALVSVCAVGARAATAAELLRHEGLDVEVLDGGMEAWSRVYDDAELSVGGAIVVQIRRRGKGCLSYLVGDQETAVVIDPSTDIDQYVRRAATRRWSITHVVDTHLHAELVGAELLLSPLDRFEFPHGNLVDDMRITIGHNVALSVSVLSTPGHTKGSTTFVLGDDALFTGDVLFLESVGRPDLADEAEAFAHALYGSLHDRVLTMPDDAMVLPAHAGAAVEVRADIPVAATLGALRASLWQLTCDEEAFVAWATSSVSTRPPSYATIVEANRTGSPVDAATRSSLEAGPNRCAVAN